MIVTTTRHGRTRRDVRNLARHLNKGLGHESRVVAIGGCPLSHADDVLAYMQAMRDGSRAAVSCHHVTLNPASSITADQRDDMVQRVLSEMGAADHPWILWEHEKPRADGEAADRHFHLVIGHIGPDGRALDDRHSYRRLESVARTLEVDWGHEITPSRRAASVARQLEAARPDVAAAVQAAQPSEPPRSSTSSRRRAAADRQGVDLPRARAEIATAWSAGGAEAVLSAGYEIAPGQRPGVYVVSREGVELGALDRLVKEKRRDVSQKMERWNAADRKHQAADESNPGSATDLSRNDRREDRGRKARAAASTPPGAARGAERSPRTHGHTRDHSSRPEADHADARRYGQKVGSAAREALSRRALALLPLGSVRPFRSLLRVALLRRRPWRQLEDRRFRRALAQAPGLLGRVSMRAQELRDEIARIRREHEVRLDVRYPRPERGARAGGEQPSFRI
jgi:hypothetical protein